MQFEYDIFISYSRKDNKPLADGGKGWVSRFHQYLEVRLTQLLGEKPRFLHYGNEEKPSAMELKKACVLVSVLSPNYVVDGESVEDIRVFFENAEKNNNVQIAGKERIFKAEKMPVSLEQQPAKIRNLLGYDMYSVHPETGEAREVANFFEAEAEKTFWMRLDDLAHDISDILREVKISREKSLSTEVDAVYLAETGHDLTIERDLIKRELQRHGYRVLPDYELPTNIREMEAAIRKDLKECKLSIHLIGDSYGEIPEGSEKSIVEIQNQLAAEHSNHVAAIPGASRAGEFNRLIWVSPGVKLINERQKLFIESLKRDAESINGAEVVQTPLEDLKNIIRTELLNEQLTSLVESDNAGKGSLYLIYDQVDENAGVEIADYIRNRGNEVLTPTFKGDLLQVRNHHFDNLRHCNVALIYYGKASEQWVQMKVLDVLKAPGLGRTRPIAAKAILVEKGPKLNKEKFRNYDITIIENNSGIAVSLEPIMAKISK